MAGRPMGSIDAGEASAMRTRCTTRPPMSDPASGPSWNGWGNDLFMGGCAGATRGEQCPSPMGPDADIGNSPTLLVEGWNVFDFLGMYQQLGWIPASVAPA